MLRSRAPVRIDFAGGWTDVATFCEETPGFVLNATINLYSYVTVKKLPDNGVKIYSADFDVYVEASEVKKLEYDGTVDLAKAAIKNLRLDGGINIVTRSDAPAGSGLGTSASMGVALCGALSENYYLVHDMAEMASGIERRELGILGGKQDQYASAYGGISFMEFRNEDVIIFPLYLRKDTTYELEKNLVLCYTGQSRLSSDIHSSVVGNYEKDPTTKDAIEALKQIATNTKNALISGRLDDFGKLLSDNWEQQRRLHKSVTNEQIDLIYHLGIQSGAVGGKACGAGGGGCFIFYCPDTEHIVRQNLETYGVKVIDFTFDYEGLVVWEG